jgi:hypothetical protein
MDVPYTLPRGVTGFWSDGEPPPVTDLRAFRADCHAAARELGGTLLTFEGAGEDGHVRNYARAVFDLPGVGMVALLLNAHYPVVVFADADTLTGTPPLFKDVTALAAWFAANTTGRYRVLTAEEAGAPVTDTACRLLAPAEMAQVRYWRPERIGDILFNHWD